MNVMNFDVAGAADRLVAYGKELIACQSARQAEFVIHDRERAAAYLDRLLAFMDAVNLPDNPLDLPKTHPTAYSVAVFPANEAIEAVENAEVKDLVWRLKAAYVEITESQSKDRASGFERADHERIKQLVENAREIIKLGETPIDLPEQVDERPVVSRGKAKG